MEYFVIFYDYLLFFQHSFTYIFNLILKGFTSYGYFHPRLFLCLFFSFQVLFCLLFFLLFSFCPLPPIFSSEATIWLLMSVRMSICPYVYLSVCPYVHLSVCPSVRMSICLYVRFWRKHDFLVPNWDRALLLMDVFILVFISFFLFSHGLSVSFSLFLCISLSLYPFLSL